MGTGNSIDLASDRTMRRRRRSLATVLAGTVLGALLTAASGFSGLFPALGRGASAATFTFSLFPTQTPTVSAFPDPAALEVGVRFSSDLPGRVSAVRFWKGAGNDGVHIGSLWDIVGNRLATATFTSETASGWQTAVFDAPVTIAPNTLYVASYFAPNGHYAFDQGDDPGSFALPRENPPLRVAASTPLAGNGVYRYGSESRFPTDTHVNSNYWVDVVFETDATATPYDQGPGGPILQISSAANGFSRYPCEILSAEGFNSYACTDIANVTPDVLAGSEVAVLGEMTLTPAQVTMFTEWVNAGGKLIALRPDRQLSTLLGLVPQVGALSDGYLRIDPSGPGAGLVTETMQFHGPADLYLAGTGTQVVATLYSTAEAATPHPAVTSRTVGFGRAAAFTYDLARSVVRTRQGNPAWAGQNRDGDNGDPFLRANDMFYGALSTDPQPDYVDPAKIQIPQADEQQRLLGHLIESMSQRPIPRLWYLPSGLRAAVVMTGDDHGYTSMGAPNGTVGRFEVEKALSPPGCVVADWACVRSTSYIYPELSTRGLTDAIAKGFTDEGFEIGAHASSNGDCPAQWSDVATLDAIYLPVLQAFAAAFPSLTLPTTNRIHCLAWNDWASHPKVEALHGMRFDTNYYYWGPSFVQDRPGLFTGSGFPQRFADLDGSLIDVYQAATQLTDESGMNLPAHIATLLDNALGPKGYFGTFTANMHTDLAASAGHAAIVAAAQQRGVPVVSAKQMLNWVDARNASSFSPTVWDGRRLEFTFNSAAHNPTVMLPLNFQGRQLQSITVNGVPVPFRTETVKGTAYGTAVQAPTGAYVATYRSSLHVGDTVFLDVDRDNVRGAADTPVNGARAQLISSAGAVVGDIVTAADGRYRFDDLLPGLYRVRVSRPAGSTIVPIAPNVGGDDTLDSDTVADPAATGQATTAPFDLQISRDDVDSGWCACGTASLGDRVWFDGDGNGRQDAGELGVDGVTVTLLRDGVPTGVPQTTGAQGRASGEYRFTGLDAGTYAVRVSGVPAERQLTLRNAAGSTDANDSDADPVTAVTDAVTLVAGADVRDTDIGLIIRSSATTTTTTTTTTSIAPTTSTTSTTAPSTPTTTTTIAPTTSTTSTTAPATPTTTIAPTTSTTSTTAPATPTTTTTTTTIAPTTSTTAPPTPTTTTTSTTAPPTTTTTIAPTTTAPTTTAPTTTAPTTTTPTTTTTPLETTTTITSTPTTTTPPANTSPTTTTSPLAPVTTPGAPLVVVIAPAPTIPPAASPPAAPPASAPPATVGSTTPPSTVISTTPVPACVGDTVFRGSGGDGPGIEGVTVTLTRPDGTIDRATTDASGRYRFCGLPPATYTVAVTGGIGADLQSTYELDGNRDGATTLVLAGTDNLAVDFGFGSATVAGVIEEQTPVTPAFTGTDPRLQLLWAAALLLFGAGLFGLATTRPSGRPARAGR